MNDNTSCWNDYNCGIALDVIIYHIYTLSCYFLLLLFLLGSNISMAVHRNSLLGLHLYRMKNNNKKKYINRKR